MNSLSNISAYQEISQTKYMHCQASVERNICSCICRSGPHSPMCASESSSWTEAGFSQGCEGFCPAVAKHNIHMNLHAQPCVSSPKNRGSPSCLYHLCSLAQHLLGQVESGPSTRHKKPLM